MKHWVSVILIIILIAGSGYAGELQVENNLFDLPFFTSVDQALSYELFIEPEYRPEAHQVDGYIEVLDQIAYLDVYLPTEETPVTVTSLMFMMSFEEASILYEDLYDTCVNKWGLPDISHSLLIRSDDMTAEWIFEETDEPIFVDQVLKGEIETPICYEHVWNTDKQHEYKMTIYEMFRNVQTISIDMRLILD